MSSLPRRDFLTGTAAAAATTAVSADANPAETAQPEPVSPPPEPVRGNEGIVPA